MKKILVLTLSLSAFLCADEFVEYGPSIGGYGEIHYNMEGEELDYHRYIFYIDNVFDDKWSFKSEVEIEHNMVGAGNDGYIAIEQAYLNYNGGNWGFKGGVVLVPVGITNEYHEPPTFLSVERPEYSKYIIPTTWFGNGFQFYGSLGDVNWKFNLMEDLDGSGIGDGIRSGRAKGEDSYTTDWTKTLQLSWTGMDGLKVGGSVTMNDAPIMAADGYWSLEGTGGCQDSYGDSVAIGNENDCTDGTTHSWTVPAVENTWNDAVTASTVGVQLMEVNATYSKNNLYARLEYGSIDYTDNPKAESSSGYYLDLGYDVSSMLGCDGKLMPWMRTSSYNKDDNGDATDISLFGVTYWPNENVSLKFEMGSKNDDDVMRMGLGYMF